MKKVNVSTKNMGKFAGKWVAIHPDTNRVIAAGETLKEISAFVTGKVGEKEKIKAYSFKVPRKDEGPRIVLQELLLLLTLVQPFLFLKRK